MPEALDALRKMAWEEGLNFDLDHELLKDIVATDTTTFGGKLPREAVRSLIDMTLAQSEWMASMQSETVQTKKGFAPLIDYTGPVLFPVDEASGEKKGTKPTTSYIPYECKRARADLELTKDQIREAKNLGITNFSDLIRAGWMKAIRNNLADLLINGDESITSPANDWELSRSRNDGLLRLTAADPHILDAEGAIFEKAVFDKMLRDMMPTKYRGLAHRWWCNPAIQDAWASTIAHVVTEGSIDGLTAQALTNRRITPPNGVPFLNIPQLSTESGPSAAPDAVSDEGYARAQVDTLFGGYDAGHAGRKVRVVYLPTGAERSGTVIDVGPGALYFDTTDYYGQVACDTDASNYLAYIADEATLLLADPSNFGLIFLGEWEADVDYDKSRRTFMFYLFIAWDLVMINADAVVRVNRVKLPALTFPSS